MPFVSTKRASSEKSVCTIKPTCFSQRINSVSTPSCHRLGRAGSTGRTGDSALPALSPSRQAWPFARRRARSGNGPYYRYHHGENKLSPRQQEDIMQILAKYGSTDGLAFDHYEVDYDFS